MNSIGYIWRPNVFDTQPMTSMQMAYQSRSQMTEMLLSIATKNIHEFLGGIEEEKSKIERYVADTEIFVDSNRVAAFKTCLNKLSAETGVLVSDFRTIAQDPYSQLALLEEARRKGIIVVSLNQTSILKLSFEMAFEMQEQLTLMPMRVSMAGHRSRAEDNYEKLRDLMIEGATVDAIARELQQSKMTIFRWRKLFEERLAVEIPGFKIAD